MKMKLHANLQFSDTIAIRLATVEFNTHRKRGVITRFNHDQLPKEISKGRFIHELDVALQVMYKEDVSIYSFSLTEFMTVVVSVDSSIH